MRFPRLAVEPGWPAGHKVVAEKRPVHTSGERDTGQAMGSRLRSQRQGQQETGGAVLPLLFSLLAFQQGLDKRRLKKGEHFRQVDLRHQIQEGAFAR